MLIIKLFLLHVNGVLWESETCGEKNSSEHAYLSSNIKEKRNTRNGRKLDISNEPCNFLSSAATRSSLRAAGRSGKHRILVMFPLFPAYPSGIRLLPMATERWTVVPSRSIPVGNQITEWFDVHFPALTALDIDPSSFQRFWKLSVNKTVKFLNFRVIWFFFLFLCFLTKKMLKDNQIVRALSLTRI